MKLTRPSRIVAAAITLFSILFMQLAVASYVCPALTTGHGEPALSVADSTGGVVACDVVDPDEPSLCFAHDQAGNQSLDKPATPPLPPFLPVGFVLQLTSLDPVPPATSYPTTFLTHATAPPLAIRNCCFRI